MDGRAKPLFSVVIPTFNRRGMVVRAATSVAEQSLRDFELIVVDDGSTDGTREALDRQDLAGLRWIALGENQGRSRARNRGLAAARGDWVTFLDSDDEAFPGWLEAFARHTSDDRVDIISCGCAEVPTDPGTAPRNLLPRRLGMLYSEYTVLFLAGTFAARRSVLQEVGGYDELLEFSENSDLALRILDHCATRGRRVAAIDAPLVRHHRRPASARVTRSSAGDRLRAAERILTKHGERYRRYNIRGLANYSAIAGINAHRLGKTALGRRHLADAARTWPRDWRHLARLALSFVPPVACWFWSGPMGRDAG